MPSKVYFEKWLKLDFFQQKELSPDELILPHPRLQERTFFKTLNDLQPIDTSFFRDESKGNA